ncbi:hypothetical protein Pelo_16244 [Pelomyxa schiedti]|nr:hypothetical protein Pelo_16244 [Pelomyxa schiedti]
MQGNACIPTSETEYVPTSLCVTHTGTGTRTQIGGIPVIQLHNHIGDIFSGLTTINDCACEGEFYRAVHKATNKNVLIRFLSKNSLEQRNLSRDLEALDRKKSNGYVLPVYEIYEDKCYLALVSEQPPNLTGPVDILTWNSTPRALSDIATLISQICKACLAVEYNVCPVPSRILIFEDTQLHIKFADLTVHSLQDPQTTYCGCPDFLSPEVLMCHKLNPVQLCSWSIGCLLYTFISGLPPFYRTENFQVIRNIIGLKYTFEPMWENIPDAKDLVTQLLIREQRPDCTYILQHPFICNSLCITETEILSLMMATHPRCGRDSFASILPVFVFEYIFSFGIRCYLPYDIASSIKRYRDRNWATSPLAVPIF